MAIQTPLCQYAEGHCAGVFLAKADPCAAQELAEKFITEAKVDERYAENILETFGFQAD